MDYLQYLQVIGLQYALLGRFKPCYKWITFNTDRHEKDLLNQTMNPEF